MSSFKKFIALAALALSTHALAEPVAPAQTPVAATAPTLVPSNQNSAYSSDPGLHFILPIGITFGGDTLATANFTNGDSKSIKAGRLLQIGLGGLYQFDSMPLALSLSANYHFDSVTAANGDLKFKRYPIEMLAYYSGMQKFRVGGGIRMVNSPEATTTLNGATKKIAFDNTTGLILEMGFKMSKSSWLNLRYVSEKYQGKTYTYTTGATASLAGTPKVDGSHFGLFFLGEF